MGYMTAFGACIVCGRLFSFSPTKVPSVPADMSPTGQKEPICKDCVERANPLRVQSGLQPITILPGAYSGDPDTPESELEWDREHGCIEF